MDGYEISYTPESVITHYSVLVSGRELSGIEEDTRSLATADPNSIRRPDNLHGLSPWEGRSRPKPGAAALAAEARQLIGSLDGRGAWLRDGVIGKSNRLLSRPLRRLGGQQRGLARADHPAQENDTVEVFIGQQPPLEKIISSADFARNLTRLGEHYVQVR